MRRKNHLKISAVLIFSIIVLLLANILDAAIWVDRHFFSQNEFIDNRESINGGSYIYGKIPALQIGSINNPQNAYLHLNLRFRPDSSEGYPNVFQTADVNRGVRLEITGTTAGLVIHDSDSPNGVRALILTTSLEKGRWYFLEVEILNGSFVRAVLDGKEVRAEGGRLDLETSKILVGAGFDSTRAFRGQIDQISLLKGNLSLPERSLKLVYIVLIFATFIFVFLLHLISKEYAAVQKTIDRLAILVLPLIIMLAYSEYRLSSVNTSYFTKRISLEQRIEKVEVLVTGSSNTVYGINPDAFSRPGFNLAFLGNGMFFDAKLVDEYSKRMPNLKLVVLTANFFTMGLDYSTFSQSWRQYFLRQYFNTLPYSTSGVPYDLGYWLNPRSFSKIALFGDHAGKYIFRKNNSPIDNITTPSGWFDSGYFHGDEKSVKLGEDAAVAHSTTSNVMNYDLNLGYWDDMIQKLKNKNVDVVIVLLPTDFSYHSHLDKSKAGLMLRKLNELASKNGIGIYDYTNDPRFSLVDYTAVMPDHMNSEGALKFSKIVDQEVIRPRQFH